MIALITQLGANSLCYELVVVIYLLCFLLVCATAPSKIYPSVFFLARYMVQGTVVHTLGTKHMLLVNKK